MGGLIGLLIGATIGIYVLSAIWEFVLFKRVMDDPLKGKLASSASAYLSGSVLYGFGAADGGPFVPAGFALYLIPALIVGALGWKRGSALRKSAAHEGVFE